MSGGLAAEISGGDFIKGFTTGIIVSAFNHAAHEAAEGGEIDPLPDGRSIWELSDEEFALLSDPATRSQVTGCDCDIELSISERLYLLGKALGFVSPTARLVNVAGKMSFAIKSVDDVIANPNVLQGKSLEQVQSVIGNSKNWVNDVMRKSSRADGWVLREVNHNGSEFTGRMIQYHPGTPRHFGGAPYWKVSSGNGTFRIPLNP